jgi:hypothetical protein
LWKAECAHGFQLFDSTERIFRPKKLSKPHATLVSRLTPAAPLGCSFLHSSSPFCFPLSFVFSISTFPTLFPIIIILMAWDQLVVSQLSTFSLIATTDAVSQINKPHLAYTILGGFTSIFMLCSLFIKERLYIGEASEQLLSLACVAADLCSRCDDMWDNIRPVRCRPVCAFRLGQCRPDHFGMFSDRTGCTVFCCRCRIA